MKVHTVFADFIIQKRGERAESIEKEEYRDKARRKNGGRWVMGFLFIIKDEWYICGETENNFLGNR